jgi:hypothetical protein
VQDDDATNESENETAPGAQLAGVVAVQGAEVEGEVEQRSFGLRVAKAASNASKASVVAQQTETLESRLAALEQRRAELEAARENGTISASRFRAEMAGLAARISTLQELTNTTAETAAGLPADVLAERGVNVSAIQRLRTSAANLSGPAVAEIARSIAGPPNGTIGPPTNVSDGPPFGPTGEENRTTGAPDDTPGAENRTTGAPDDTPGAENRTTGAPEDTPGNGQQASENASNGASENATNGAGENATEGVGAGNGTDAPGANATTGSGPDAPTNGTDVPGNGTDAPTNGTDVPGNGTDAPTNGTETGYAIDAPTVAADLSSSVETTL